MLSPLCSICNVILSKTLRTSCFYYVQYVIEIRKEVEKRVKQTTDKEVNLNSISVLLGIPG